MNKDFNSSIQERRSIYAITKESPVSDDRIQEIIEFAVKYTPSAFNSQSARVVVLLGQNHNKLWDITKETLRKIVPAENFSATEEKINSFRNGYGTVLFFEDKSIIEGLQKQFALYKDNFPVWSQQSSGMLQLVIWTSLENEGLGASLQHYNPLIDEEVKKEWNIPGNWKLIGQMPFGKPSAQPDEKQFQPLEDRVKIIK
ncbi:nitroreductase family protein [Clostridium sp. YIM B02515]|uniref:Nitroreductase family protein n=1 Tax=Clostridium rhizosphaerae TaxID=2803861 RepID=A0ABS1TBJ6_9CLOT|nr:nitroreductase family protein [Clostridium rhizosphaerae]MBL4936729.1 nitroreductase family protein [Clostridium rhizosphaerae]